MHRFLILLMIIGLALIVAGCPEDKTESGTVSDAADVLKDSEETFSDSDVDTVEAGDLRITVHKVEKLGDSVLSQADEGNIFMVVDLTVGNLSNEVKTFSTVFQLTATDAEGTTFSQRFHEDLGDGLDGEVAAQGEISGAVLYEVPEDATGLLLTFDASLLEDISVTVDLGDAADLE